MAIYTYRCAQCGRTAEVIQSIRSYCEKPDIPHCDGGLMQRYFTKPLVTFDTPPWAAYVSPIDGSTITSRREQNEHMARHGVVLLDDIKPDIERNRKRIQQEAAQERKKDVIESIKKVEAGYKPPPLESVADIVPRA